MLDFTVRVRHIQKKMKETRLYSLNTSDCIMQNVRQFLLVEKNNFIERMVGPKISRIFRGLLFIDSPLHTKVKEFFDLNVFQISKISFIFL